MKRNCLLLEEEFSLSWRRENLMVTSPKSNMEIYRQLPLYLILHLRDVLHLTASKELLQTTLVL